MIGLDVDFIGGDFNVVVNGPVAAMRSDEAHTRRMLHAPTKCEQRK